jgi:ribosomal protein L37E
VSEQPSITCPHCGRTSYNQGDIDHKFCGACGYHERFVGALREIRRHRSNGSQVRELVDQALESIDVVVIPLPDDVVILGDVVVTGAETRSLEQRAVEAGGFAPHHECAHGHHVPEDCTTCVTSLEKYGRSKRPCAICKELTTASMICGRCLERNFDEATDAAFTRSLASNAVDTKEVPATPPRLDRTKMRPSREILGWEWDCPWCGTIVRAPRTAGTRREMEDAGTDPRCSKCRTK